ncbi:MAG: TonB-dependent receptor [Pseudomonadales bacterium]
MKFKQLTTACSLPVLISSIALGVAPQANAILEEVIVTTQKRAESLQSIPLAVTAFSGEELGNMGITDIKGVTERTPGFTMGSFNAGQPQLYIRGIGSNEDSPAGDQSVIVFVDEVYIGRSAGMDVDLFDLERVEVLRGPQGTLFGKNVVGGAVSMITTKPTDELKMKFEAGIGNYQAINFRGLVSGPLAENVFGKVSFSSRRRDGYVDSRAIDYPGFFEPAEVFNLNDIQQSDLNTDSVRGALRFTPSSEMEINVSANFSRMDQAGPGRHFIGAADGSSRWHTAESALIANYDNEIRTNVAEDPGFSKIDIAGVTARLDYDFSDFTFTSLSSFRKVESSISNLVFGTPSQTNLLLSNGGAPLLSGSNPYTDDSDTFTQEFRFTSTGGGKLQWVAGLYYLQEQTVRNETGPIGVFGSNGAGGSIPFVPIGDGGSLGDNTTDSYAIFGQFTYAVTDQLSVSVGGRQTWEEKDFISIGTPTPLAPTRNFSLNLNEDWSAFTPKVTVDYQFTDNAFVYFTYSEGFKSGGFPGGGGNVEIASTGFDPEEAILYELGAKTEWFDNRVRLNVAAFQTDYTDLQILQLLVPVDADPNDPGNLITQNAADAEINGVEVEFTFAPIDNLIIQGSYTTLDTEFSDFFIPAGFRAPSTAGGAAPDRTGNSLRNAPESAYNILVRYDQELANGGAMRYQLDHRYKDEVVQDPDELEFAKVPEYDVTDLRISYMAPEDSYQITLWMKNAFDEDYFLHNFPVQGTGFATPALPRTYGVTFSWNR